MRYDFTLSVDQALKSLRFFSTIYAADIILQRFTFLRMPVYPGDILSRNYQNF